MKELKSLQELTDTIKKLYASYDDINILIEMGYEENDASMVKELEAEIKEFEEEYSYGYLCEQAQKQKIVSLVDCNDDRFLAPPSMVEAVKEYCRGTGQQVPENEWEIAAVIYNSLGKCYGDTISQLEKMTKERYDRIYVVGGGSNAEYLNQVTAEYTGRTVYAGPGEATAIGNLLVQMIYNQELEGLKKARECVQKSFDIKKYEKGELLC